MKNQENSKQQTPQNGNESPNTAPKKPVPEQRQENQDSKPQNVADQNKKDEKVNPGGKEHQVGDLPGTGTTKSGTKNEDNDITKIKDPDPTIPEKRNDPVAGKGEDYARTMNTPGKTESNEVGEFAEIDEMDREEGETSDASGDEDENEPGSFDAEEHQKEAFGGERKNSPDERKNQNGL